jgi:hypothetical protein
VSATDEGVTARPRSVAQAAQELGARVAVAVALSVALVSLLRHAPVWLASLRGAATLVVLAALVRLGAGALARAAELDVEARRRR